MTAINERPVTDKKEQAQSEFIGPVNGYWAVEYVAGARAAWGTFFTKAEASSYMDANDNLAEPNGHLEAYYVEFNE
jgi:hypothetical protein